MDGCGCYHREACLTPGRNAPAYDPTHLACVGRPFMGRLM